MSCVIKESYLNERGIFIEERPHRSLKGYTEDFININGKEYQTNCASYSEKTLAVWDGDNMVKDIEGLFKE